MTSEFVKFPKIPRYNRDVVVTEKIDGTNGQIYITASGRMLVGSNKRWLDNTVKGGDNHGFAQWAYSHEEELHELGPGRHYGEWWGSGIQRKYGMKNGEKHFSLFNTNRWTHERPACCNVVPILWTGPFAELDTFNILTDLKYHGSHVAPFFMNPEGIVIFHTQGYLSFKRTFNKDSTGKWDV